MAARLLIGDVSDRLADLDDGTVDCLITSPPYYQLRSYLPDSHPSSDHEIGTEATPGDYLEALLAVMDAVWPKLADHATFWVVLGDSHAGSGGSGGDYNEGGLREGQARWMGTSRASRQPGARTPWHGTRDGWPAEQSVCWLPHLFGASLAYGRNLLTGAEHRTWITRPPVTWCKPSPPVGELRRRFRTATELVVYGGKHQHHWFDLDAVRHEPVPTNERNTVDGRVIPGQPPRKSLRITNPAGAPPLTWWVVGHGGGFDGEHFATYPAALLQRPIEAGCPRWVCRHCGRPRERIVESEHVPHDGDRPLPSTGYFESHGSDTFSTRTTVGWTECACDGGDTRWRPGLILDPFSGSGTTIVAATSRGRDAVGIDLDERSWRLTVDRMGPLMAAMHGLTDAPATVGTAQITGAVL